MDPVTTQENPWIRTRCHGVETQGCNPFVLEPRIGWQQAKRKWNTARVSYMYWGQNKNWMDSFYFFFCFGIQAPVFEWLFKEQNLQTEDILNTQILTNLKTETKKKKWRQNKDTIHLKARYLIPYTYCKTVHTTENLLVHG